MNCNAPCFVLSLMQYSILNFMRSLHDKIWEAALNALKIRPQSVLEMKQKLGAKFPGEEEMTLKVIEEMQNVQLLNDRHFTEEFVHHLIQKPIGRIKIMVETRRKGLDSNLVEQMLLNESWDEEASAERAIREKERLIHNESDPRKRKAKFINFLRSRGFRDEVIYKTTAHSSPD